MAQVRSVLTAQVLALTEHVSALTKQFTLFQFEQRHLSVGIGGEEGGLPGAAVERTHLHMAKRAAEQRHQQPGFVAIAGIGHAVDRQHRVPSAPLA